MILTGSALSEAKVVMLGSTTVGKSSVVMRFHRETFNPDTTATIGAAFVSKVVPSVDPKIKLQIWDTGGSERYRSMAPIYFQDADAAIIVYDITSPVSYTEVQTWLAELREKGPPSLVIALVGNKADREEDRKVATEDADAFAKENNLDLFMETSALTGDHVQKLFEDVSDVVLSRSASHKKGGNEGVDLKSSRSRPSKKSKCC